MHKMTKEPKFKCCECGEGIGLLNIYTISSQSYFDINSGMPVHPTKKYCEECFEKITKPNSSNLTNKEIKKEIVKESTKEFKEDEGVQLVDEYSEVKTKLNELKKQEEEFKEKLIGYAKQFEIDAIYGSNKKCSVKSYKKVVYPEDKNELIELMKKKGIWKEFEMINYSRFQSRAIKGDVDDEVLGKVEFEDRFRIGLRKKE